MSIMRVFTKRIGPSALFVLGISLFLIFGCISSDRPASPSVPSSSNSSRLSLPSNATPSASANLTPVPLPLSSPECALTLSPDKISAGDNTTLIIQVNLSGASGIYYLCGNQTRQYFVSGTVDFSRSCVFDTPGEQLVWVATDQGTCAQAFLKVDPAPPAPSSAPPSLTPAHPGNCSIVADSRTSNIESNTWTYEATVQYSGYLPNSTLSWDCQYSKFSKGIGIPFPGQKAPDSISGILHINCQYAFYPRNLDALPVFVNNDYCGDLLK
ncbi:MAG: hypothetical protein V1728_04120 [Candidatus Micrarchaeota archaeon]